MSNKLCSFPWVHMAANQSGDLILCCNTYKNSPIKKNNNSNWKLQDVDDPLEYFNSDYYKKIRLQMINDIEPEVCKKCFDIERSGGRSIRQNSLDENNINLLLSKTNLLTGELNELTLNYVHFMWGNKCNLKCKMCDPSSSDQLIEEFHNMKMTHDPKKFLEYSSDWNYKKNKNILEKIAPYIEIFNVTGGEPSVNNDFLEYCYYLDDNEFSKNISFAFHTNLNVLPTKFVSIWNKFKNVTVKISIDAIGKDYEYIRYPGKWKILEKNLLQLQEIVKNVDSIGVEFHTVFSSFNAHAIPDLLRYLLKIDSKYFLNFPNTLRVTNPTYADPRCIPVKIKEQIAEELYKIINQINIDIDDRTNNHIKNLKSNIQYMLSSDLDQESFYEFNKKQDQFRTIKTEEIISWTNK